MAKCDWCGFEDPDGQKFTPVVMSRGQMDQPRFLREVRKVRMHQQRLNSAPVLLDDHHLAALHLEAVKRYGMDPKTSIIGAHLFGHELTQAND